MLLRDLKERPRSVADAIAALKWAIQDSRMSRHAKDKVGLAPSEVLTCLTVQMPPVASQKSAGALVRFADLSMYTPAELQLPEPFPLHPKSIPYVISGKSICAAPLYLFKMIHCVV